VDYLRDEDDDGFSLEEGREGEGHFRKDQGFFPQADVVIDGSASGHVTGNVFEIEGQPRTGRGLKKYFV
jgi:hypothetical protein